MLEPKKKYLQIALNSTLQDAASVIRQVPLDERIIIEAGTPLIKNYGAAGIKRIRQWWEQRIFGFNTEPRRASQANIWWLNMIAKAAEKKQMGPKKISSKPIKSPFIPYIVADLKCMDRGEAEVAIAKDGGANAVTCLGHAPTETMDAFIENCEKTGMDSMVDMMNVSYPLNILRQLKKMPQVVILHRGVDEECFNPEKEIPYHEIQRIKGSYDIMIAVAGGDTIQEIQRSLFNDADIAVVWKSFYRSTAETAKLADDFLKEIR